MAERNEKGREKPDAAPGIARMFLVFPFVIDSLRSARIDRFRGHLSPRITPNPRIETKFPFAGFHRRDPRNPWGEASRSRVSRAALFAASSIRSGPVVTGRAQRTDVATPHPHNGW
jgi:hypothetical protein